MGSTSGCVTIYGAIKGLRVDEMDAYLGMQACSKGVWIVQATRLPELNGFKLAGDTSLSTNKLEFEGK